MEYIKQLIINGIEDGIFPGAVVCLSREGEPPLLSAYGYRMLVPKRSPMHVGTLFDLASLTKPVATATSIMRMRELRYIDLNDDVTIYLPEFARPGIKIFHLLTHTSGLPAWKPIYLEVDDRSKVVEYLGKLPLEHEPGGKVLYSCLGYILLGEIVWAVTRISLDKFAHEEIFKPLGMNDTFFNPPEDRQEECAATEDSNSFERRMTNYRRYNWREGVVVGEVHDENAHFLGGVAGNAGLFSTASDLAKFCSMIINNGKDILSPESVRMMATVQTLGLNESRSIGWIILPDGTLYHTGFTGTAIWINLPYRSFAILLTNRVHPDAGREGIIEFRKIFYDNWRRKLGEE